MRGFLASLALVETALLARCAATCLGGRDGAQAGGMEDLELTSDGLFASRESCLLGISLQKGRSEVSLLFFFFFSSLFFPLCLFVVAVFTRAWGLCGWGKNFCKRWTQLYPFLSDDSAGIRAGISGRKNACPKLIPWPEAGTGWIILGKWVQKVQSQKLFFGAPAAAGNLCKQQQNKAQG